MFPRELLIGSDFSVLRYLCLQWRQGLDLYESDNPVLWCGWSWESIDL